jgi:IrrE N-terminal-like domain
MSEPETSDFEYVLDQIARIWTPGAEAIRLKTEMNVRSLAETHAALAEAGYEVYAADLPVRVSGLAAMVNGRRYIVVNRYESRTQQQFTLAHELGHHVLHLNPSSAAELVGFAEGTDQEFQADQFASVWHMFGARPEEQAEVLRRNPRAGMVMSASLMATILVILVPILAYLCTRLFINKSASQK